jgi:DNA-binding GntR family transcriptional regulator
MKKLYSTVELAEMLGISRQALNQALEEGRIEESEYIIKSAKKNKRCWTAEQAERIKKTYTRRSW